MAQRNFNGMDEVSPLLVSEVGFYQHVQVLTLP